jgi:hypothetical protein
MKFPGGMNIQQLMKDAQRAQEQMAKEMDDMRVEASAGGGIISVIMTGTKELLAIKIAPEAVDDLEMLEDLIVAAVNEAGRKVDEVMNSKMGNMLSGMKIPGLM